MDPLLLLKREFYLVMQAYSQKKLAFEEASKSVTQCKLILIKIILIGCRQQIEGIDPNIGMIT